MRERGTRTCLPAERIRGRLLQHRAEETDACRSNRRIRVRRTKFHDLAAAGNFTLRPHLVFIGGEVLPETLHDIQQCDLATIYLFTILACIVDEWSDGMCSPATASVI